MQSSVVKGLTFNKKQDKVSIAVTPSAFLNSTITSLEWLPYKTELHKMYPSYLLLVVCIYIYILKILFWKTYTTAMWHLTGIKEYAVSPRGALRSSKRHQFVSSLVILSRFCASEMPKPQQAAAHHQGPYRSVPERTCWKLIKMACLDCTVTT